MPTSASTNAASANEPSRKRLNRYEEMESARSGSSEFPILEDHR